MRLPWKVYVVDYLVPTAFCGGTKMYLITKGETQVGKAEVEEMPNGTIYVFNVLTEEAFRRQGVQEAIFNKMFDDYAIKEIKLDVMANNEAARALYKKLGFLETGEYWNGYVEMSWRDCVKIPA